MADLDQYDRRILAALQKNGALTNGALSEIVRLSPSQCSRRRLARWRTIEAMVVDLPLPVAPQMRKRPFLASRKALRAGVGTLMAKGSGMALGKRRRTQRSLPLVTIWLTR